MAKSERSSVFIPDNNINNNNNSSEFDEKIEEHEREPLTRYDSVNKFSFILLHSFMLIHLKIIKIKSLIMFSIIFQLK